jgi:hypothetical protein
MLTQAFEELTRPEHCMVYLDALEYTECTELPIPNAREFFAEIDVYLSELWMGTMTAEEAMPMVKQVGDPVLQANL